MYGCRCPDTHYKCSRGREPDLLCRCAVSLARAQARSSLADVVCGGRTADRGQTWAGSRQTLVDRGNHRLPEVEGYHQSSTSVPVVNIDTFFTSHLKRHHFSQVLTMFLQFWSDEYDYPPPPPPPSPSHPSSCIPPPLISLQKNNYCDFSHFLAIHATICTR